MIKLSNPATGRQYFVSAENIARVIEAGASSQWHGVKSLVKCFDGETLEVNEEAAWIAERVANERQGS